MTCAAKSFSPLLEVADGVSASAVVALADFDGDGLLDEVATDSDRDDVSILLGNGDGTFQPPVRHATGESPVDLAVADLNGDGRPDIVTANDAAQTLSVLLGDADGTFVRAADFGTGAAPLSIALADLNGDGHVDAAVSTGAANLQVMPGAGDGTFGTPVPYDLGTSQAYLQAGDVDGDGRADVVAVEADMNQVSVWLQDALGNLTASAQYSTGMWPTGNQPKSAAISDLNHDGVADLVVGGESTEIGVFLGAGAGLFSPVVSYSTTWSDLDVAIGDMNRDGNPDVVTAGGRDNRVRILLGNGDGTFQSDQGTTLYGQPESVALGNLNGGDSLDIVIGSKLYDVVTLLGNGDGTVLAVGQRPQVSPVDAASTDMNGDGKLDLVVVNYATSNVAILLGRGDFTFEPPSYFDVPNGAGFPTQVAIGDLNGDRKQDIVVCGLDGGTVYVLLGNGDGSLQMAVGYDAGFGATTAAVADVNKDGVVDIVTPASALLGKGDGTFSPMTPLQTLPGCFLSGIAVSDFDRNGIADLAITECGGAQVVLGNGDGTFQQPQQYGGSVSSTSLALTDLDRDGFQDIVMSDYRSTDIGVLLGNGDGTFGPSIGYSVGMVTRAVVALDADQDGRMDVAAVNDVTSTTNAASLMLGNGDGTLSPPFQFTVGSSPRHLSAADLNGDGLTDLIIPSVGRNNVGILPGVIGCGG